MEELINKYMNQGVTVTTIESWETGRLTAYSDGWLTISNKGKETEINSEYIVKIQKINIKEKKIK